MNYLCIGKLVNTHGIKGEVRILSKFKRKELVFKKDFKFYIGRNKNEYIVESYRVHKNFDMVVFKDNYNINLVEFLKGSYVYVNKDDIKLSENEFLAIDLIGFSVIIDDKLIGKVIDVVETNANDVLVLDFNIMIPYVKEFILNINKDDKTILVKNVKGLIS